MKEVTFMGCHTWFLRPITKAEFNAMKEYALVSIMIQMKGW